MIDCLSLGFLNFLVPGNSLSNSCMLLLPLAPGHLKLAQEDLVVLVGISPQSSHSKCPYLITKVLPWSICFMLKNIAIEDEKLYVETVKNCEGSEMLPDLRANKLA